MSHELNEQEIVRREKMEALRYLEYLNPSGKVVVNNFEIKPLSALAGKVEYSKDIIKELNEKADTTTIDAAKKAKELGNSKVMNVILLGAIVKLMNLSEIDWEKIIEENVKAHTVDLNKKALNLGMELV